MDDIWKVLFHPFTSGAIDMPGERARVLFLGAEPEFLLPAGFDAELRLVQGFKPYHRVLEAAGFTVFPSPAGEGYEAALVVAGRHRGRNERRVAEAMRRVLPGGQILVAGGKEDGIASLRKRVGTLLPLDGHLSKYHGIAFWFANPADGAVADALVEANPPLQVEGRFQTKPGMFSFDRIDAGSKFLTENLPSDIKGEVADFAAGWGYLSAELLSRGLPLSRLDLYEADYESLEAARGNLSASGTPPRGFFWHDLIGETVARRYDTIVMNPPFHTARAAEPQLGQEMIHKAANALKPGGRLFLVANRPLPYEKVLAEAFSAHGETARNDRFKVLWGWR